MSESPISSAPHDRAEQIRRVIETLLLRRAGGEQVLDEAVLAEHPDLQPELAGQLRKVALIARACEQLPPPNPCCDPDVAQTAAETIVFSPSGAVPRASRSLEIRCPHCHEPLTILTDQPLDDLHCLSCHGRFSLAGDDPELKCQQPVTRIAHFELLARLGMGSFGTVWKARDVQLDRTVALKIPRRKQLDAGQIEGFLHEAWVAAKLRHPNIVSVHEISRDGENLYIVSDFIDGISLESHKKTHPMTQREAAELLATVCDALHFAHQAGIVHRDLKPSNILIDVAGQPHIADFGLAKRGHDEVAITMRGDILGTPAYMSPEQARGDAHRADRRTDIYSVGVVLFELLTGFLPFRGNVVALTHHAIHTEPPSPRRLNATVSRDLETICLKCLEKDPARRYDSAAEVAAELRRFLAGDEILARPISRPERLWRWCRKNPRIPTLSAALLLVTLVAYGIAWYWFENQVGRTERTLTERALASVRFAAESVAAQAGNDLEKYFDLAEQAARDPTLIAQLQALFADSELRAVRTKLRDFTSDESSADVAAARARLADHPLRMAMQAWIENYAADLPLFASFVLLADGLQIARHPEEGRETIGRNYAWRAYFHGRPQDHEKSWRPTETDFLRQTVLSPPFVTEFTDEWVVVISTPISTADSPQQALGVFGVMVRLGSFARLPGNARSTPSSVEEVDSSFAVLVDSRTTHQGQILQHPLLQELDDSPATRARSEGSTSPSRRRLLLDRSQRERSLRADLGESMLQSAYRDPYGQIDDKYNARWLAAQWPVTARGAPTGLSVIVQEHYDQTIGQPLAQMRRGLFLLSLVTLGLATAVIVPLWGIILRLVR
jgi:serine/threonine protein kinase